MRETNSPVPNNTLLEYWLEVSNNPAKEPTLKAAVEFSKLLDAGLVELKEGHDPVDIKQLVLFKDFEHASKAESQLKVYITIQWTPWAVGKEAPPQYPALWEVIYTEAAVGRLDY